MLLPGYRAIVCSWKYILGCELRRLVPGSSGQTNGTKCNKRIVAALRDMVFRPHRKASFQLYPICLEATLASISTVLSNLSNPSQARAIVPLPGKCKLCDSMRRSSNLLLRLPERRTTNAYFPTHNVGVFLMTRQYHEFLACCCCILPSR